MNFDFTNSSGQGGFMGPGMMYGGNFVDILFRTLMEKGWEGFTFVALFNFYMYLSLDKIKELFKCANDKLSEMGKQKIETYGSLTLEKSKAYAGLLADKLKRFDFRKPKRKVDQPIEKKEPVINKATVTLNCSNKTDLMALGNFILKNKKIINLHDYHRESSDKYKSTESYAIPNSIQFGRKTLSNGRDNCNVEMRITQNIDYTLICETDSKIEILKDIRFTKPEGNYEVDWTSFAAIVSKHKFPHAITSWIPDCNQNYYCDCKNFCGGHCIGILMYMVYTKNFNLFKNFYKFLMAKETFDFGGKKYKLVNNGSFIQGFEIEDKMNAFVKELETYVDGTLIPHYAPHKDSIDIWMAKLKPMFEPVIMNIPAINLHFESKNMSNNQLCDYSRKFMSELIAEYYHESHDNIGNKISIYQLNIRYDIEIKRKENPEYAKWQLKYGKKEKDEEKDKDNERSSDDDKGKDKDKSDDKKENDDKKGESESRKKLKGDISYDDSYYDYPSFGMHYMHGYKHSPMEPSKFIEEEIYTPMAESKHIKSDKKPFQYLYLQKSDKELLESYLSNFKNNRELYEKMGICFKGGIFLSGPAGNGKSSTTLAIGCYLNKDIYYLDLGKIKTNNELQLCVEYVKTSSQCGGVIVFEDVDCMTDIVKKRIRDNTDQINNEFELVPKKITGENDALSLSFLLNILDGTMAPENIIFVMTSNHKELLDPALIRPGRMDISINIEKCGKYQLEQIYNDLYGKYPKKENLDRFREHTFITAEVIMHLFHNVYNKNVSEEELLKKFLEN